jgi:hypothetical protein
MMMKTRVNGKKGQLFMEQAHVFNNAFVRWFLKQARIALVSIQFLTMLRRLWLRLPFAFRKNMLAACGRRERRYSLDFPLNMRDLAFTAQEMRPVLQQYMPSNMTFTVFSGNPDRPAGSGTYIKCDAHGSFKILTEQGTCQGLMTWLFPVMSTDQATSYSKAFAH